MFVFVTFILGIIILIIGVVTNLDILCLAGVGILCLGSRLISPYIDWRYSLSNAHPTITFKQFITFYNASPKGWKLCDEQVFYNGDPVDFKTFIDYVRYIPLVKGIEYKERKRISAEVQLKFVKSLQKDVNKQYDEINSFIKKQDVDILKGEPHK